MDSGRTPKTSVVMATYKGEAFLPEQLASLAQQTQLPDELIISDDASTDGTVEIARAFAKTAPFRVEVAVNPKNVGYAKNFASAVGRCSGDLLFFCDQDDIWLSEKISAVTQIAASCPQQVISHDISIFSAIPEKPAYSSYFRYLREQGFPAAVCLKGCSLSVKREFIEAWGWPPKNSNISHDFWIALLATALDQRLYIEEVLIRHRLHSMNTSGWLASNVDRVRLRDQVGSTDRSETEAEVLIDLCMKTWRLHWIAPFLKVLKRPGVPARPELVEKLIVSLETHRTLLLTMREPFAKRALRAAVSRLRRFKEFLLGGS